MLPPAILYGLTLIATGLAMRFYRGKCPRCQQRGLKQINSVRATVIIDGQRAPDHWTDYACEQCGAMVRWHRSAWETLPEVAPRQHA